MMLTRQMTCFLLATSFSACQTTGKPAPFPMAEAPPMNGKGSPPSSQAKRSSPKPVLHLEWPTEGPVSSEYGIRWGKLHKGIDITGNKGQGIVASAKGKVMSIGWVRGYGYTVVLQHQTMAQGRPHVFRTLYAHCQKKMLVKKGDTVEQGQKIALMGRTGNATAFLLHFEYRNSSNKPENPRSVLPQRKDLQLYSYAR